MPISFRMTEEGEIYDVKTVRGKTRAYNRMYYHEKLKGDFKREHCEKTYSSESARRRHQARSMKCNWIKAMAELSVLGVPAPPMPTLSRARVRR